jgi:hypothetical protein
MSIKLLSADEQAKIEADIRTMILEHSSKNGGITEMARTMSIVYDRAWNQLNRNQGVRVGFLAAYEVATGDCRPLDRLADAVGRRMVSQARGHSLVENLHREVVQLSIDCGRTQEMIEVAYEDRRVTAQEYRRVHSLCNKLISLVSALDEQMKKEAI